MSRSQTINYPRGNLESMYDNPSTLPLQGADPLGHSKTYQERQAILPYHQHPQYPGDVKQLETFQKEYDRGHSYDVVLANYYGELLEPALAPDIYSLLYTANLCSTGFFFAFFTFGLQFGLLWLVMFNSLDTSSENPYTTNNVVNRLRMPAGVDTTVTSAQCLGLLLTVLLMAKEEGNAVQGISQLTEGYEVDIKLRVPNATCFRWFISGVLRTSTGLMFAVLAFILTMQSNSVISLVLYLTGLIFLQEIDDWGFQLASSGLLGTGAQDACKQVMDIQQLVPEITKNRIWLTKRVLVLVLFPSLLVPYSLLAHQQATGKYQCSTVYVQFGDLYLPQYAYYSGLFQRKPSQRVPIYVDPTKTLELAWCRAEGAWTISMTNANSCEYIFKSSPAAAYDVLDAEGSIWYVRTNQTGDVPMDWMAISCNDCSNNPDRCRGQCVDNTCVSDELGRRGLNYQFPPATCDSFSADQTTTSSLNTIPGASLFLNNIFTTLVPDPLLPDSNLKMNNLLLYTGMDDTGTAQLVSTFLLFSGRRWIMFGLSQGVTANALTLSKLVQFMNANDPNQNNVATLRNISSSDLFIAHRPLFFSSPMDYGTDSYSAEPSSVTWLHAEADASESILGYRADERKPVKIKLHCARCSDGDNPCLNGGICETGSCQCPTFFNGLMCEYAIGCMDVGSSCFHNQTCNSFSNICSCDPGYFGNLCQYESDNPKDPFFCESYSCKDGICECSSTMIDTAAPGSVMPGTGAPGSATTVPGVIITISPGTAVPGHALPGTVVPGFATTAPGANITTAFPETIVPGFVTTVPGVNITTAPETAAQGSTFPATIIPGFATMAPFVNLTTAPETAVQGSAFPATIIPGLATAAPLVSLTPAPETALQGSALPGTIVPGLATAGPFVNVNTTPPGTATPLGV